jgi:hypothetical protein
MLLRRLRAEGHRVLLFAQMTKMLDILEVLLVSLCIPVLVEVQLLDKITDGIPKSSSVE